MNLEPLGTGNVPGKWSRDPLVSGEAAVRVNPDLARASFLREGEEGEPPPRWPKQFATAATERDQATAQMTYVLGDQLLSS